MTAPGCRFLLLGALAVLACPAAIAETISPGVYGQRLRAIDDALVHSDAPRARSLARSLAGGRVAWPGGDLPVDGSLLAQVGSNASGQVRVRIAALVAVVAAIDGHAAAARPPEPDGSALSAIAEREDAADLSLAEGGRITGPHLAADAVPPSVLDRLAQAWHWLGDRLSDLLEWLRRWFTPDGGDEAPGQSGHGVVILTLVGVGVLLVAAVVLALLAIRRQPPVAAPVLARAPQADADPRSRPADEWRRYAHELERQGRWREAIRAWYHALLVTCWARGLIHHRTGRTNWEYAFALAAALGWRSSFHDLTRRFDLAWYGGREDPAYGQDAEGLLAAIDLPVVPPAVPVRGPA